MSSQYASDKEANNSNITKTRVMVLVKLRIHTYDNHQLLVNIYGGYQLHVNTYDGYNLHVNTYITFRNMYIFTMTIRYM